MGQGLLYRVAGAQLFGLLDEGDVVAGYALFDLVGAVTDDSEQLLGTQLTCAVHHMLEQGPTAYGVKYFGQVRMHARAFTGREYDDIQRKSHKVSTPSTAPGRWVFSAWVQAPGASVVPIITVGRKQKRAARLPFFTTLCVFRNYRLRPIFLRMDCKVRSCAEASAS